MVLSIISAVFVLLYLVLSIKLIREYTNREIDAIIMAPIYLILTIGLIATVFHFTLIPVMLLTVTIALGVVDGGLGYLCYRKKKLAFRKMDISVREVIGCAVVVLAVLVACIYHFGINLRLQYIDIDSARYLKLAMELRRGHRINGEYLSPLILTLSIQWLEPFVAAVSMYKGMILAHITIQILSGAMFWCLANRLNKGRYPQWVTVVLSLLYVSGFQLYILTYGTFFHWEDGILILMFVIYQVLELHEEHMQKFYVFSFLAGIFGLFICYPFFLVMTGSILLVDVISWIRKHLPRSNSKAKKIAAVVLIVLGVLGGHFVRQRSATISGIFENLRTEGLAYKEPYMDFIFFLPILIAYAYIIIRNRDTIKERTILRMNLSGLVFIVVWFVIYASGHLSNYYYYRNYYILWLLAWLMVAHAIGILKEHGQGILLSTYGVLYGLAVLSSIFVINEKLENINATMFLEKKTNQTLCPLYTFTYDKLENKVDSAVSTKMFELYSYVLENLETEEVPMLTSYYSVMRSAWYHAITDVDHLNPTYDLRTHKLYWTLRALDERETKYVLYQKDDITWKKYKKPILSQLEVVKSNKEGAILKLPDGMTWMELLNGFTGVPEDELEIIDYIAHCIAPNNLRILAGKKEIKQSVYTAYFGENTTDYVGVITKGNLLSKLKLLDESETEAVIILKTSEIYLSNKEYWDRQVVVYENDGCLLVGPNSVKWEDSK